MTLYLDTTALVKLYVSEPGRYLVVAALEEATGVATSVVAYVEARSAFAHRYCDGGLTGEAYAQIIRDLDADWPAYERIAVSDTLAHVARDFTARFRLRGFDALHLAAAFSLHKHRSNVKFITFDRKLLEAAMQIMPVYETLTEFDDLHTLLL